MARLLPDPIVTVEVAAALKRRLAMAAPATAVPVKPALSVMFAFVQEPTASVALVVTEIRTFEPSLVAKLVTPAAVVIVAQLPMVFALPTFRTLVPAPERTNPTVEAALRVITPVVVTRLKVWEPLATVLRVKSEDVLAVRLATV